MSDAIDLVIRAARAGELATVELFRALSATKLLLAGAPNEAGAFAPQVLSWDGVDYAAVFTSKALSTALPDAPGFAEMTGRELGANWPEGLGAAINPGIDDLALVLDATAVRMLADPDQAIKLAGEAEGAGAAAPRRDGVRAGEKVAIGAPANPPAPEFVEAVRASVGAAAGVDCAYVFQMVDGSQTPRLMVGVVLVAGSDEQQTMTSLVNAVAAVHAPASEIDFMVLGDDLRPTVAEYVDELR